MRFEFLMLRARGCASAKRSETRSFRISHTRAIALIAGLSLAAAAVHADAGAAGQVSIKPLFDLNKRFKKHEAVKLRFRVVNARGASLKAAQLSFSLRHGIDGERFAVDAKDLQKGVVELPFEPYAPGAFWIDASLRRSPEAVAAPVRLSVAGVSDGLVELPPEADADAKRAAKKIGRKGR
jgi:hypothetical protein